MSIIDGMMTREEEISELVKVNTIDICNAISKLSDKEKVIVNKAINNLIDLAVEVDYLNRNERKH